MCLASCQQSTQKRSSPQANSVRAWGGGRGSESFPVTLHPPYLLESAEGETKQRVLIREQADIIPSTTPNWLEISPGLYCGTVSQALFGIKIQWQRDPWVICNVCPSQAWRASSIPTSCLSSLHITPLSPECSGDFFWHRFLQNSFLSKSSILESSTFNLIAT